ncbi:MAG: hypothetical protein ACUVXA_19095 [Candidatus Jordarchaeum sp.]|uniref:hypothetical protein n=1 Tax=Candidatus Jordarchaeum sp. TaxID=2823881 RepID=UPI00404B1525
MGKFRTTVPDAYFIEEAVNEGWIRVEEMNEGEVSKVAKAFKIHTFEAEAILLAKKKGTLILLDQTRVREAAKGLKLYPRGKIYVLRLAYRNQLISKKQYLKSIDELIENDFPISIEVYKEGRKIE